MKKPNGYWTKERCHKLSKKCKTKVSFMRKYYATYQAALKNNWLNEICSHMKLLRKPKGYYTKEKCAEIAKKCQNKEEFRKIDSTAHRTSQKNGWINDVCSHMISPYKPSGYWTKEYCSEIAKQCKTKGEFYKKFSRAYSVSLKNNWLNEICSHMRYRLYQHWDKEKCIKISKKFRTLKEFQKKHPGAFFFLRKRGLLKELKFPISELRKPNGYWTKEKCIDVLKHCKTKGEFYTKHSTLYNIFRKKVWCKKFFSKLPKKN